jgi:hypothetical protein
MLENLEDLQGFKRETYAGYKSQSTFCLRCPVPLSPRASFWSPALPYGFCATTQNLTACWLKAPAASSLVHHHHTQLTCCRQRLRPKTAACHALRTRHMARLLLPEVRLSSIVPSNCAYFDLPSIQIRHSINLSCHDSRGALFPSGQGTMR